MRQSHVFTVLDAWAAALRSDASFLGWCASQAGGSLTVFVGLDPRHVPQAGDCPFVHLTPGEDSTGLFAEGDDGLRYTVGMDCGLKYEKAGRSQSGNLVSLDALRTVAEMGQRALNVLAGTDYLPEIVTSLYPAEEFPLVIRAMHVTTTQTPVIDTDRTWAEN